MLIINEVITYCFPHLTIFCVHPLGLPPFEIGAALLALERLKLITIMEQSESTLYDATLRLTAVSSTGVYSSRALRLIVTPLPLRR